MSGPYAQDSSCSFWGLVQSHQPQHSYFGRSVHLQHADQQKHRPCHFPLDHVQDAEFLDEAMKVQFVTVDVCFVTAFIGAVWTISKACSCCWSWRLQGPLRFLCWRCMLHCKRCTSLHQDHQWTQSISMGRVCKGCINNFKIYKNILWNF
jgi:hypothetical protein